MDTIKPFLSAYEFLNGEKRWCIWLENAEPADLKRLTTIWNRISKVKNHRVESSRETTNKLADFPTLFAEIRQPKTDYILIPRVSSENRKYIPMQIFPPTAIVGDTCLAIANGSLYELGILSSSMHMAWVKYTCGRLKSDFRYSNEIVYNNFPWPENIFDKHKKAIEKATQKVVDVRLSFSTNSLADLYDPLTMPPALVKAHNELDKAVDFAYRSISFINETKRLEFLFELYDRYTAGLFVKEKRIRKK